MADRTGIEPTLMAMAVLPLIAAVLALPLPAGTSAHAAPRASDATTAEGIGTTVADRRSVGTD
jgi:hypothetical protein